MAETLLQLPEWLSALNKKDRNKVLKQCEKTILCIPVGGGKPLTEREVVATLGIKRAFVLGDDHTGGYWIRSSDEENQLFLGRLDERGLQGYTTRAVVQEGEDWRRLLEKLAVDYLSPLQNSTGQGIASSSTSHLIAAPGEDDAQIGGKLTLPAGGSVDVGGSGSGLLGTSPQSASFISPTAATNSDGHSATGPEFPKRARKKARLTLGGESQGPSTPSPPPEERFLDMFFAKLAPEVIAHIFELCLEGAATSGEYNRILKLLDDQGGRCRKILRDVPSFWTKISSSFPDSHISTALESSQRRPLYIEGDPNPSLTTSVGVKRLAEFLWLIKPHRRRWTSLSLLFPSGMLTKVKNYLARPALALEVLSLSMADAALETGLALPLGNGLSEEIGSSLDILGKEAGKLQRVLINNIPCVWDPSPFTAIVDLVLTNGIHLRYTDLVTFLRRSPNLRSLRLVNIKFVGGAPRVVKEPALLPNLTDLVLAELVEPIGLGGLYLSLVAPNCENLHLDLRPSAAVMRHPALPLKVASTVQKALALDHGSFLSFRPNLNTQSASWRSQDEDGNGWSDEQPSFNISFRGTDRELAGFFCAFVRGVRMSVGDTGSVVVNLGRSVSGTIQETFGLELDQVVPTLSPSFFEGLNVVEVRADVVDGFLQYLKETLGPVGSEDWRLGALQTIRLRAIPKGKLKVMPEELARCCLEDLIGHIRRERYGIGLDEPKPEDEETMSIILRKKFMIQKETARALEEGDTLWGIEIDHSAATLVYPGGEEEKVEGEVEEGEVEEDEVEEDEVEEDEVEEDEVEEDEVEEDEVEEDRSD